MTAQRLKVAIIQLDVHLFWARNLFRRNFNQWKFSRKEAGQISLNDNMDMEKGSRFKYATRNIRGFGEKEEE